jgi:transcriptional regulator with XRE-family HTH domain
MKRARNQFSHALRKLRAERGWSQEELAERSGLHRTYVSGIERGTRNVSLDNLERIANAFGLPVSSLFLIGEQEGANDR